MGMGKGIFAGEDPFVIARRWLDEARETEPSDPDAAALATVDDSGLPNVRIVLMRAITDESFGFFTNYNSAKGQELDSAGKAALVFHWKTLQRQIRVRGVVTRATAQASDDYYQSRALGSRIGAWASEQSQPLHSRATLMEKVAKAGVHHGLSPKRPPFWGGYVIRPHEIEFWAAGEFRLHDRFRWRRETEAATWQIERLNP
ncbi:Pyridoxine/pyridoxamine 5'-phosphate oxidase [Aquimixticola soesokkakensis]|uniref:Pyridoxine/pyridoxamine 5'-phosphate oxidase n=1 Tax=Aquimixticola soesokkakensis TaxID=1519096 RepID=A0A1Y5TJ60_9RHOB|nr:pyridoxamine 5'-phosphate oxidase [Aquimixticola soesokkakensis]SLN65547.1 Pyridoxine/pyridoxamine 5'-phosphate oxidase [Aquimixticola soesokkakensis]